MDGMSMVAGGYDRRALWAIGLGQTGRMVFQMKGC